MEYKFEYRGFTYESDDFEDVANYVMTWIEDNWELFVEWTNYLVTKDNFEQYAEDFVVETVIGL